MKIGLDFENLVSILEKNWVNFWNWKKNISKYLKKQKKNKVNKCNSMKYLLLYFHPASLRFSEVLGCPSLKQTFVIEFPSALMLIIFREITKVSIVWRTVYFNKRWWKHHTVELFNDSSIVVGQTLLTELFWWIFLWTMLKNSMRLKSK